MYEKNRRPSEIIAMQREVIRQQEQIIEVLKGALAAAGEDRVPAFEPWMVGLTPQERSLVGALYSHYPRPVDRYDLLDLLPGQDHVEERQVQLVSVKVSHLRKKLGPEAIESIRGAGYRLGKDLYETMKRGGEIRPAARPRIVAVDGALARRAA